MLRFFFVALLAASFLIFQPAAPRHVEAQSFPATIDLPDGWLPEGIVTGNGPTLYSGSRRHGGVYAADLRTGEGEIVVPPQTGRIAVGMDFDSRTGYLFVAGGPGGAGNVYDTETGASVTSFQFVTLPASTFVNDVIVTREAAYFTDSFRPFIYRVALGPNGEPAGGFTSMPLSGDYVHQMGFNVNGIVATPSGDRLIIVQTGTGLLFSVDPTTGDAIEIDLNGYSVSAGDGLLLHGKTLYVVRNQLNLVAELELSPDLTSGVLVQEITDARLDTPTTIDRLGSALYVVNARFSAGTDPSVTYTVERIER
jgi:hypothetical protein